MVSEPVRQAWEGMLDADMNARYWGRLARRYGKLEVSAKILLATTSSGTVAGWALWADLPVLWRVLSGVSAVLAVALPFLSFPDKVERGAELCGKWSRILSEYEAIWPIARGGEEPAHVLKAIQRLKGSESELSRTEVKLPRIVRLVKKCQEEVKRSRGL